jgi:hypothetical protein
LPAGLLRENTRHHLRHRRLPLWYQEETYSAFVHEIGELLSAEDRIDTVVATERDHWLVGA